MKPFLVAVAVLVFTASSPAFAQMKAVLVGSMDQNPRATTGEMREARRKMLAQVKELEREMRVLILLSEDDGGLREWKNASDRPFMRRRTSACLSQQVSALRELMRSTQLDRVRAEPNFLRIVIKLRTSKSEPAASLSSRVIDSSEVGPEEWDWNENVAPHRSGYRLSLRVLQVTAGAVDGAGCGLVSEKELLKAQKREVLDEIAEANERAQDAQVKYIKQRDLGRQRLGEIDLAISKMRDRKVTQSKSKPGAEPAPSSKSHSSQASGG